MKTLHHNMNRIPLHNTVTRSGRSFTSPSYHFPACSISQCPRFASSDTTNGNGRARDRESTTKPSKPTQTSHTRTQRHRTASAEVQSLFEQSTARTDSSSEPRNSAAASRNPNITFLSSGPYSQPTDSRSTAASVEGSSAPSSLKERLRQRAAERDRHRLPKQGNRPNTGASFRINRTDQGSQGRFPNRSENAGSLAARARSATSQNRRPGKRRQKREEVEKGAPFQEYDYVDEEPDAENMRVYERVLMKYGQAGIRGEDVPGEDKIDSDPDVIRYREIMDNRMIKPTRESVATMPVGMHNETLGSGLDPIASFERLLAMARLKNKGEWAGVESGEESDVKSLADGMPVDVKAGLQQSDMAGTISPTNSVLQKWIGGLYEPPKEDVDDMRSNVMRGVMMNKSYSSSDSAEFLKQFEKLVDPADIRPKGKVAEAVQAGAREAAMKQRPKRKSAS